MNCAIDATRRMAAPNIVQRDFVHRINATDHSARKNPPSISGIAVGVLNHH